MSKNAPTFLGINDRESFSVCPIMEYQKDKYIQSFLGTDLFNKLKITLSNCITYAPKFVSFMMNLSQRVLTG